MRARARSLQPRSHAPARAMRELGGALPRFAGSLQQDEPERAVAGGNRDRAIVDRQDLSRLAGLLHRLDLDQLQIAAKSARPGIERAELVIDRLRRIAPADLALRFVDLRRERRA